ncbi:hypothetical protein A9Z42_0086230 [Trichoderma parareesei]|uniref:Uncharacterized protein n=1 Tax=Trichoderma parareesei TaxID=858221 RepID=A0A2H2ZSM4_TRIPA|nr:hypothetical protein A9Z42_0086230 [Trichoderma parareesei]
MGESAFGVDSKVDLDEAVSLSACDEKEARDSKSASRWAEALQKLGKEDQAQFELALKSLDDLKSVLSNVLAATDIRKEECKKKRWKLSIKGQTVIMRDVLEKLSAWVQKILAVGDVVIQYDPSHMALPWAAVRLIMQVTVNDIEVFGHVINSLENISNLVAQCQLIEVIYLVERRKSSDELFGQLSESITDLYAAILAYLAGALHYFGLNTAVRILKSVVVSKDDVKTRYEPIESAQAKFRRLAEMAEAQDLGSVVDGIQGIEQHLQQMTERDAVEMQSLKDAMKQLSQPINRIDSRLEQIQDGIEQQVRTQILKAISTIPYGSHHKTASKGRLEGSGRWLLSKSVFGEWRKRSYSSVLWLHGIPGSGKTKLASLVVDEIRGKEHLAYFYCLRNPAEPHRAQCDKILASFVRQLASLTPSDPILPPVIEHYEEAIEGFVGFEDQAWTSDECVEVLLRLVDEYPAVTFVLDALDEVDQEDRQDLLDALDRILKESSTLVRVFISSRSNYDIALKLSGAPNIYIEADDNAEDISTFMFRWVDLQIQSLKRVKVAADLKARLGALPATLEESYWEIYQEIREAGDHAFGLANFTFQWLLYAQESISIEALAALASSESTSESETAFSGDEVLDVCSNLIVTRQNSFDFVHLSVREFFERLSNRGIHSYQLEACHAAIAAACLRYLNMALVDNRGLDLREKVMQNIKELQVTILVDIKNSNASGVSDEQEKEAGEAGEAGEDGGGARENGDASSQYEGTNEVEESDERSEDGDVEDPAGQETKKDSDKTAKKIAKWSKNMEDDDLIGRSAEILAVASSDDDYGQPSEYATTWVMYHIEKSSKHRLESPLANLIKAFVLEKSGDSGDLAYKVSRAFHVWSALMTKVVRDSEQSRELKWAASLPPSPIWVVCQMNWIEVAEYLYNCSYPGINDGRKMHTSERELDVNPLWYAILSKKADLIDCLTKCNADANRVFIVDTYDEPIVTAARKNDTELITILSKQNYGGQKAAEEAFIGFDVLSTALVIALSNSDETCADLLLEHGAKKDGLALVRAIRDKTAMTALKLIEAGYDVNGRYLDKRRTALHYAALSGQTRIVEALLGASADVNRVDANARTPLHLAALSGHVDCVRLLMKHGADVLCEDCQGKIPLDLAEEKNHVEAERVIREEMETMLRKLMAAREGGTGAVQA